MPFYVFYNTKTDEQFEELMSWNDRVSFLEANPHIEPVITAAKFGQIGDRVKPDDGFKDVLNKIAEDNPHTPLADRYGSKSTTDVKVRETVKKVRNKVGGSVKD
jgi:hypothetical protein